VTCVPQPVLPLATSQWEAVLVDHFLRISENGEASPIRSFEVTAETLALASRVVGATPEEAENAFKAAMCADRYIWSALRDGHCRRATAVLPYCFTYLAMTLLIDTLLDGDYSDRGQFRDRLRIWLRTKRRLMDLSGIAVMWRELASWLDARVETGQPFRRLLLPSPGAWTQIGYTRRLSFPTRADARFLDRVMSGFSKGASDPPGLIRAIEAEIGRGAASWGMQAAFEEFRTLLRAGAASTDHRFWRLVLRSAKATDRPGQIEAVLELEFDEDGRCLIVLGSADDGAALKVVNDLGVAMRSGIVTRSANLAQSANRGFTFFRQVGMARWRATSNPYLSGATEMYLALSSAHGHMASKASPNLSRSGDWLRTPEPISMQKIDDLLRRLQLRRPRGELLLDISLAGGVRVGGAWLGRKTFLPSMEVGNRHITVTRLPGQSDGPQITFRNGVLVSRKSVEGAYQVDARARDDGSPPEWSCRLRLVADATPHAELREAAYREPLVREWLSFEIARAHPVRSHALTWSDAVLASGDLLEALYAIGSSGRSEAEIFDVIARGTDGMVQPWSLLRTIQESGFLEARNRSGWRGRIWTLGKLSLSPMIGDVSNTAVVKGAMCVALEREFREVVSGLGGKAFRRLGISPWVPAVIGATDVDLHALASRLGWQVSPATSLLEPRLRPDPLEESVLLAEHHVLASSWDWNRRQFVKGSVGPSSVSLTRWVHPAGRDHDVYRVKSSEHFSSHMTRNAAILTAHIVAGTPLFRAVDDTLIRTSKEGALPLEFAEWFRLVELSGGGALGEQGYGYPINRRYLAHIARALPGCVEGIAQGTSQRSKEEVLMASRRSGGRGRLLWVDGTMEVKH
jgi:hypothetical protein